MCTLTFFSVPFVVTVMPLDGSAFAPLAGVIVTTGPGGFAGAVAEALPPACAAAAAVSPADLAAVVPPLVHAASAIPSAASAVIPVSLFMSELFPTLGASQRRTFPPECHLAE